MEILTDFGVDWHVLVVSIVNFVVLAVILWFVMIKPLITTLLSRESTITESLKRAELERQEADVLKDELVAKRAKAVDEAKQLVADATVRAAGIVKQAETDAGKRVTEIMKVGEAKLATERADMLASATQELAEVVIDATAIVVGKIVTADVDKKLVEQALAEAK